MRRIDLVGFFVACLALVAIGLYYSSWQVSCGIGGAAFVGSLFGTPKFFRWIWPEIDERIVKPLVFFFVVSFFIFFAVPFMALQRKTGRKPTVWRQHGHRPHY
jgi:uncharacterized membrane protein required for colicin V production